MDIPLLVSARTALQKAISDLEAAGLCDPHHPDSDLLKSLKRNEMHLKKRIAVVSVSAAGKRKK